MVPHHIRISWNHLVGEQRLYLEGPEVVQNVGLAAHFETRFRHFWQRSPPRLPKDKYMQYKEKLRAKQVDYGVYGGDGDLPHPGYVSRVHKKVSPEISDKHKHLHDHKKEATEQKEATEDREPEYKTCRPKLKKRK